MKIEPVVSYVFADGGFDVAERVRRAYTVLFDHTYRRMQIKHNIKHNEINKS